MHLLKSTSHSDTLGAYTPDISDPHTAGQLDGFLNGRLHQDTTEWDPLVADEIHIIDFQAHISVPTPHASGHSSSTDGLNLINSLPLLD